LLRSGRHSLCGTFIDQLLFDGLSYSWGITERDEASGFTISHEFAGTDSICANDG